MDHSARNGLTTVLAGRGAGLRENLLIHHLVGRITHGRLTLKFPSGLHRHIEGASPGPQATILIHDLNLFARLLISGGIGIAESYMAGEWDTPDLATVLKLGACNAVALDRTLAPSRPVAWFNRLRHARRANTRRGSRRNIAAHYDLGNAFFRHWLDESMTYSAAIFENMDEPHETAQRRKYLRLARVLGLKPGDRVLEIGCGWGGFAMIAAAEFNCHVTGLTLSNEQAVYTRERLTQAGLADRADIRIQDYRDVAGRFDHIVSVEMFEAVGEENWVAYFDMLQRCLKPGGRIGMQVITVADDFADGYRQTPEFIQRYIFPGGMLPSPETFQRAARAGGFNVTDTFGFGASYAESLRRWDTAFQNHWPEIEKLGFDSRYQRMWRYYLRYCESGFDSGRIDVAQYALERR